MTPDMIRSMGRYPIVFALATPEPEIGYEAAMGSRRDVIVATSIDRHPNAVLDLLSFPYIFRGALDVQATRITEGMMVAAARALAGLAREDAVEEVERAYEDERFSFGPDYLLPKPIDRASCARVVAVARCAVEEGVARRPTDAETYEERLQVRMGTGREMMRGMIRAPGRPTCGSFSRRRRARRSCAPAACWWTRGSARPILLGPEDEVARATERLHVDLSSVPVIDPARSPRLEAYAEEYFRMRRRRGVLRDAASRRLRQPDYYAP